MSFNRITFSQLWAFVSGFLTILVLSACSFSPVYSGANTNGTQYDYAFEEAQSRLEQIVYADLVAAFGRSNSPDAKRVKVIVSSSPITPGTGSVGLSGKVTVIDPITGEEIFTGTRTASATFVSSGQSLANQQAANEAGERAARQLAHSIRLTLLGLPAVSPSQ